jgi:hypothetical protein
MPRTSRSYDDGFRAGYLKGIADERRINAGNDTDLVEFAAAETDLLLTQHTGYLRLGAGSDGLTWARYKWTCGPLEGFYTFGSGHNLADALAQVCTRVQEIEAGKRKATKDSPARKYPPKG